MTTIQNSPATRHSERVLREWLAREKRRTRTKELLLLIPLAALIALPTGTAVVLALL